MVHVLGCDHLPHLVYSHTTTQGSRPLPIFPSQYKDRGQLTTCLPPRTKTDFILRWDGLP